MFASVLTGWCKLKPDTPSVRLDGLASGPDKFDVSSRGRKRIRIEIAWSPRLTYKHVELPSSFAFHFKMHPYVLVRAFEVPGEDGEKAVSSVF